MAFDSQWLMLAISILTLLITCWVLYEAKKARKIGEAQLRLSSEPDLRLHAYMPNRVGINCRNWGARVTDMEVLIADQSEELSPNPHELFDEYFFHFPEQLIRGNSELLIKLSFRDKLGRKREQHFVYDANKKQILLK